MNKLLAALLAALLLLSAASAESSAGDPIEGDGASWWDAPGEAPAEELEIFELNEVALPELDASETAPPEPESEPTAESEPESAPEPLTGECGADITWTLGDDNALVLSGTGPMWDYARSPWAGDGFRIETVEIGRGITAVGARAFAGVGMRAVSFPDTVKSIGEAAFMDCGYLQSVALPEGLKTVPALAFAGCTRMKSVSLPESLKVIESEAFAEAALDSVRLPAGLEELHPMAFHSCRTISRLTVAPDSAVYADADDAIYTRDGRTLVYCAPDRTGTFKPLAGTRRIGSHAFDDSRVTEVILPDGVREIADLAFAGAINLRSLTLPASVKRIGKLFDSGAPNELAVRAVYGTRGHAYCRREDAATHGNGTVNSYVVTFNVGASGGSAELTVGERMALLTNGRSVAGYAFEGNCAWVDGDGMVTAARAGSGTVVLTAQNGSRTEIALKVTDPYTPTKVTLDGEDELLLAMDSALRLNASLSPATARSPLTWESSDRTVATVDMNGAVNPVAEGVTTITVSTANGKIDSVRVEVINPYKVRELALDRTGTALLDLEETLKLTATVSPATARTTLTWKSANDGIATVSQDGLVTPVNKGTTRITVTAANGVRASVNVKVGDLYTPVKVKLNKTGTLRLHVGEEVQFEAELTPGTARTDFHWTTSDDSIAGGSCKGASATIRARAPGTVTVTVTTYNGKSSKVKIVVSK